jgi:signal transduction histidine kinase
MRDLILRTEPAIEPDKSAAVRIHVIDTGPGISPEVLARIFQPYFTTKAGGSGLGLSTSRRLIHEHAGRIDVHTEPGKGTDFVVVLPVSQPISNVGAAAMARQSPPHGPG